MHARAVLSIKLPTLDELASRIDHALLAPYASARELERAVEELEKLRLRCLILSPPLLREARHMTKSCLGAVVAFPFGYQTIEAKVKELEDVIGYGADEVDAVLDLQLYALGRREAFANEAAALVEICRENNIRCKLIIEAGLLTRSQLADAARAVLEKARPDYLKTGTGYGPRPTQPEDVATLARVIAEHGLKGRVGVKAAGGIRTGLQAALLLAVGADIIGTSKPTQLLEDYRALLEELTGRA